MKYVISLGGSLINPEGRIDLRFLKKFREVILSFTKKGHQFLIVIGGGKLARSYQAAARGLKKINQKDLDWIGVAATRLNAELTRCVFGDTAYPSVITNPSQKLKGLKKINILSGWKEGWSTDYVAVRAAQTYAIKTVINLSNVDYVYDQDPRTHKHAKRFAYLTWTQFLKQFGSRWVPGANVPFDPVGAKLAYQLGIKVVVMNGQKLENFRKFLQRGVFKGTIIE